MAHQDLETGWQAEVEVPPPMGTREGNGVRPGAVGSPTTPPDSTDVPVAGPEGHDVALPGYYLNRELTWLNFNFRVLHEAEDSGIPLLERVKFLSIVSSNLDEFFMKRIGGLKQILGAGVHDLTVDGRTPREQIEACYELVQVLEKRRVVAFKSLVEELRAEGIHLEGVSDLSQAEQATLRDEYVKNIYPLVTPQSTDPAHPFPFVSNLSLNLLVTLRHADDATHHLARVKVPVGSGIPRLVRVGEGTRFVTLEDVMANNLDLLFPGMEIEACETFRVTRNANTESDEESADDLLAMIETELRERRFAPIVRLEVEGDMDPVRRGMITSELGLDEEQDVFSSQGLMGMRDLMELTSLDQPELKDAPHFPFDHPLMVSDRPMFHTIREAGSLLVHHPYQSFATSVERFIEEASRDPKVRAIKMTLYRTGEESSIIDHLIAAARNGKQVAVVMELKARFDEEANIRWASRLGSAGIHVTYGVVGLKTHCKVVLVVRQDYDGLRRYAHIGTGNYHAETSRVYSDLGFLTCDAAIGTDLTELFNYLTTGFKPRRKYEKLLVAPKVLKRRLLRLINRERRQQEQGGEGHIQFKLNALEDADVTKALYEAARAGVKVDIIARDTCRLRPGIDGLSESVRVRSIVGRFLEHARIYYFRNGGDERYYLGSADAMRRNLQSRVEVLVPVEDPALQEELRTVLDEQLDPTSRGWEMHADGSYSLSDPGGGESVQQRLITWAEKMHKEATRLRRRPVKGGDEGNLL